jgi:hypothetical protein
LRLAASNQPSARAKRTTRFDYNEETEVVKAKKKKARPKPYSASDMKFVETALEGQNAGIKDRKAYEENRRLLATESAEARDRPWPSAISIGSSER